MGDRGPYRAVKVVLLDGPDFQELPQLARHVFLTLKLSFGPAGIEVHYPEALAHELAAKTGAPVEGIREAMDSLSDGGWIQRERNVTWIVGQLEHDPHMNEKNERHRKSVQDHISGLPRLAIVGRFMEKYPDYFSDAPDSLSDSLPDSPKHSPSDHRVQSTENRIQSTEGTSLSRPAEPAIDESGPPLAEMHAAFTDALGGKPPHPSLTDTRRAKYRALWDEHLSEFDDWRPVWDALLAAILDSDHHMSERSYQMPESFLRNPERRDTWMQKAADRINGKVELTEGDRKLLRYRRQIDAVPLEG